MSDKYTKGFVFGALIGGTIGAITALLLAPKSGVELRKDIADKSTDAYSKAQKYFDEKEVIISDKIKTTVNEGKMKADKIVDSAKSQANEILESAERVLHDARNRTNESKEYFQDKISKVKNAVSESAEVFKQELKS
jgi:gas vesicle protein